MTRSPLPAWPSRSCLTSFRYTITLCCLLATLPPTSLQSEIGFAILPSDLNWCQLSKCPTSRLWHSSCLYQASASLADKVYWMSLLLHHRRFTANVCVSKILFHAALCHVVIRANCAGYLDLCQDLQWDSGDRYLCIQPQQGQEGEDWAHSAHACQQQGRHQGTSTSNPLLTTCL